MIAVTAPPATVAVAVALLPLPPLIVTIGESMYPEPPDDNVMEPMPKSVGFCRACAIVMAKPLSSKVSRWCKPSRYPAR